MLNEFQKELLKHSAFDTIIIIIFSSNKKSQKFTGLRKNWFSLRRGEEGWKEKRGIGYKTIADDCKKRTGH